MWRALNDLDVLRERIPGCQKIERVPDSVIEATIAAQIRARPVEGATRQLAGQFFTKFAARFEQPAAESIDGLRVPEDGLKSDLHASAGYRAHLVGVMAKCAVDAATR